jgi:ATP-dependent DNA helicase RecG
MNQRGRKLTRLEAISVSELDGVGPKKAEALGEMGIESVLDLLFHYPRRYIDRTRQSDIAEIVEGQESMVFARVERVSARRTRNGRSLVEVKVSDQSGSLGVTFFNQPWRAKQLSTGAEAVFFGKADNYRGRLQMTNPVVDLVGDQTDRIVPVYPQSEKAGLVSRELGRWVAEALRRAGELADPLPDQERQGLNLPTRTWAMQQIHCPDEVKLAYAARKRLAFDELFRLQTLLVLRKHAIEQESLGLSHETGGVLVKNFMTSLPFALTDAQARAIQDVARDMSRPQPMHRLLQGDVGSGKTLVAVVCLLNAVQSGRQGAFMAPTEVLAEQHYINVRALLEGLTVADDATLLAERPLGIALLTSKTSAADRKAIHAGLRDGSIDLLIGTHALLTETVQFASLGAVVVDEQHRFGVEQRSVLRDKGAEGAVPDVLVMTATPIPRTAAMTVYGDLDVSIIDELPPGRTPITTEWLQSAADEARGWSVLREHVAAGRQGYVVCPLVDVSEKVQAKSATQEFERLADSELSGLRLGLLHGQMPSSEKESVMAQFRAAKLDVLVSTTVIEVGVDVPNATIMVIEDAARFGIAQLHQLRGRVGRGANESFCFLLGDAKEENAEQRLQALEATTDGFELAEVDLELRGAGSILGARQSGRSDLKLATLKRSDRELVLAARGVADRIVAGDPHLEANPHLADDVSRLIDTDEAEYLFRS